MLGTRAVGHTGTLDPFATGLLVTLVGRATRLARFVEAQPKRYLATARLGFATDTDDLTGTPLGQPVEVTRLDETAVRAALAGPGPAFDGAAAPAKGLCLRRVALGRQPGEPNGEHEER